VLPERRLALASIVVLTFPELEVVESSEGAAPLDFPYIPGLLSFREMPAILAAWARLTVRPDVLLCDAHGVAHPRGFGLASHLGVALDLPTIGCAKSRLFGTHRLPAAAKGRSVPLRHPQDGSVLGAVVRTRTRFVAGLTDPSPWTARGVMIALRAAAEAVGPVENGLPTELWAGPVSSEPSTAE